MIIRTPQCFVHALPRLQACLVGVVVPAEKSIMEWAASSGHGGKSYAVSLRPAGLS